MKTRDFIKGKIGENKTKIDKKGNDGKELVEDDLLQLSLYEVFVIFLLSNFTTPMQRYALLQDVNDIIFKEKKLSTSSFYNSIEKLEKMGLIAYAKIENKIFVMGTDFGVKALEIISRTTSLFSINFNLLTEGTLKAISGKVPFENANSILIITLEEFFDTEVLNTRMKTYSTKNIITLPEQYEKMVRRGLSPDIHQTLITDKKIREPDGFFELIVIYDFQNLTNPFHGLSETGIIKETFRVLKSKGLLLFQFHNIIQEQDDFAIDLLAHSFKKSPFYNEISKEDVIKYFTEAIGQEPKLINFKEFYLGYIKKE